MAEAERPKDDLPPDPFGRAESVHVVCSLGDDDWAIRVDHGGISPWAAKALLKEALAIVEDEIVGFAEEEIIEGEEEDVEDE